MNNRELAEAFANGATSGSGSHMYIEGPVIYSYGSHFPIAFRRADGVIFFNESRYSNSTSKHQAYVSQALSDSVIRVDLADILRVIAGGKLPQFGHYKRTKAARAIISVLTKAGFSLVDDGYKLKYGELPVDIKWTKWYGCNVAGVKVALTATILTAGGDKIGEIFAADDRIKRGSNKLNMSALLLK